MSWVALEEKLPLLGEPAKVLLLTLYQLTIFVSVIYIYITTLSSSVKLPIVLQTFISVASNLPVLYLHVRSESIRSKYRILYGEKAYQCLFLRYFVHAIPLGTASFYIPLVTAKNIPFLHIVDHLLTRDILPIYLNFAMAIPVVVLGIIVRRPSGGFNLFSELCLGVLYPEQSKLLEKGAYKYVRHPRYLGRFMIVTGFALFANNALSFIMAGIHVCSHLMIIPFEEKELARRFGVQYLQYRRRTPMLIPGMKGLKELLVEQLRHYQGN